MPIRPKDRLEVFKRDGFACTYCGRKPPAVVLHVDHIVPKAEGGPDSIDNYTTSCADCNLGKGKRPLLVVEPCVFCGHDKPGLFFELPPEDPERRRVENEWKLVCTDCLGTAARAFAYMLFINDVVCAGCGAEFPRRELLERSKGEFTMRFKTEDFVAGGLAWICDKCETELRGEG